MTVSIYEKVPTEKKEPEFLLQLKQSGSSVYLIMVDSDGKEIPSGWLLRITKDMRLERIDYINNQLGLPLDEKRQLKLVKEEEEDDF